MLALKDKIIFITGASSGIGEACAHLFAAQGAKLILTARRIERLQTLVTTLEKEHKGKYLAFSLDVREEKAIQKLVKKLPPEWQAIDILVNNAGLALGLEPLHLGLSSDWNTMIDTNIKGLLYATQTILPGMLERGRGHIINLGSIAGQENYPNGNVYAATKHAVRSISKSLRLDLLGSPIRVSEIAPGAVETEFSTVRFSDSEKATKFYESFMPLQASDIADAILYAITRPAHVNVAEITIMPTVQASANHLKRN